MSNGDTQDTSTTKTKKTTAEKIGVAGTELTKLGETIETLFGKPSASPMSMTPSNVPTGPPSVTAPTSGAGARFDPRGAAGGGLPNAPGGTMSAPPRQPAIQSMGTEYATPQGAQGAVASSALSSVVGALHNISSQK